MSEQKKPNRNRKSIRYTKRSYNEVGYYFITICCHQNRCLFDTSIIQETVAQTWERMLSMPCGANISLDEYVVVPNHFHGLIFVETDHGFILPREFPNRYPNTLVKVVSAFKGLVTKQVRALNKAIGTDMPVWKRGYHDRIVRDETELERIRHYIRENPVRWREGQENLAVLTEKMTFHG